MSSSCCIACVRKRYKNINQAMGDFKKFFDTVKEALAAATDLSAVLVYQAKLVFQSPSETLNGCVFTGDPECRQLLYAKGLQPVYTEYNIGHYRRSFTLSNKVDQNRIGAEMKDGVLTITLPKAEEAKPRRISVN